MTTLTLFNDFHGTETTIRPREDGTISAATYRRARRALCPSSTCCCPTTPELGQAEPIYEGAVVIAYRLHQP